MGRYWMLRSQLNHAGIALTPEQFRLPCGHNRYSCEPFCRSLSRSPRPFRAMTPRHPSLKVGVGLCNPRARSAADGVKAHWRNERASRKNRRSMQPKGLV